MRAKIKGQLNSKTMKNKLQTIALAVLVCLLTYISVVTASTITTLPDNIFASKAVIDTNFVNLNTDKIEIGGDISGSTTTPTVADLTITGEATGTLVMFDGSGWEVLAPGTSGKFLQSNGVGNVLTYETVTAITSLNGSTSSTQAFATSTETNLGITIGTANGVHTFTPTWIGTLADGRITSAATWNAKQSAISFPIPVASSSLVAGRSLTLSTDTLNADAELYTEERGFSIPNASSTVYNGAMQKTFFLASTITEIRCSTNGSDITIGTDERASSTPDSAGTDIFNGGTLVCDSNGNSTTTFANASMAVGAILNVEFDVTANSTTTFRFAVKYTKND